MRDTPRALFSDDLSLLQRLQELHLQENSIELLEDQALAGLSSLALLDLSRNQLGMPGWVDTVRVARGGLWKEEQSQPLSMLLAQLPALQPLTAVSFAEEQTCPY